MISRKPWSTTEIDQLKEMYPVTDTEKFAETLGRTIKSVRSKANSMQIKKDYDYIRKKRMESEIYALYKGDEMLVVGTLEEIARHQKIKTETVRFLSSPAYHHRIKDAEGDRKVVIKIEE